MRRFRITKIVYAKDFASALSKEKKINPVEISLDEEVLDPTIKLRTIGFHGKNGRKQVVPSPDEGAAEDIL